MRKSGFLMLKALKSAPHLNDRNGYPFHFLPHTEIGIDGDTPFPYGDVLWFPTYGNAGKSQFLRKKNGKDALQCVTQRSAKTTVTISIRGVTNGNGQGDFNIPIWGIPISE